jgi:hypothetical protein
MVIESFIFIFRMETGGDSQREAGEYHKSKNCATTQDQLFQQLLKKTTAIKSSSLILPYGWQEDS